MTDIVPSPISCAVAAPRQDPSSALPVISSQDLLAGHREIAIDHGGVLYRLRLTSNGKLILFK